MSTYVMSDIHGRGNAYLSMLEKIQFSDKDKLYIIGDVIDRGPSGIKIILDIMSRNNIELLMGNHELMMLQAIRKEFDPNIWFRNGGYITLVNFMEESESNQKAILEFMGALEYTKELSYNDINYYLVHGRPPLQTVHESNVFIPHWLREMPENEQILWDEMQSPYLIPNTTVIFGHRCTKHYQTNLPYAIFKTNGAIGIDCGCAYGNGHGRLGCVKLETMEEYYTTFNTE